MQDAHNGLLDTEGLEDPTVSKMVEGQNSAASEQAAGAAANAAAAGNGKQLVDLALSGEKNTCAHRFSGACGKIAPKVCLPIFIEE